MAAESIAFSDVAVRQRAYEKARARRAAQQNAAPPPEPEVVLPQPIERADTPDAPKAAREERYPQKLAKMRYRSALTRESSQLAQAEAITYTSALLLVGTTLALVLGYIFSLPPYFPFYLYFCSVPALFAVSLFLTRLALLREPPSGLPPQEESLSVERWCELLSDAALIRTAQNDRRQVCLQAAQIVLCAGIANLIVGLIVWVCIGA